MLRLAWKVIVAAVTLWIVFTDSPLWMKLLAAATAVLLAVTEFMRHRRERDTNG